MDTLESLVIEIKYKASNAASEIKKVSSSIKAMSDEAKNESHPLS